MRVWEEFSARLQLLKTAGMRWESLIGNQRSWEELLEKVVCGGSFGWATD
jgi:hypothetical protein